MVKNAHLATNICPHVRVIDGGEVVDGDENGFRYKGSVICMGCGMECYQMEDHHLTAEAARICNRHPRYKL